ncbi:MAG: class II fructose-bisphosphate aldolase [Acidobacteriota bacterium]
MEVYGSIEDLREDLGPAAALGAGLDFHDLSLFRRQHLDRLVYSAVFAPQESVRQASRWVIRKGAGAAGICSASIHDLYTARGRGEWSGFTVPAINIRGLTYDTARAVFRAAIQRDVGAVILEIARSEIGYTEQRPAEYTAVVTAAALREGWCGPLFLQGDHFQFNAARHAVDPEAETQAVLDLTQEAIEAGFLNIDIDSSTLVDLSRATVEEQQRTNFQRAAQCLRAIRTWQPDGVTISVGAEIGEVGKKNSTRGELIAFMEGLSREMERAEAAQPGPSKISVQTGSSHGGIPLPDGRVAEVSIDFETLRELSQLSRQRFQMAGAVQHGASTLPRELFHRFPQVETAEIHLATGFQNIIYEHASFPAALIQEIEDHLKTAHADERRPGQSEAQFLYKTRKKAFGPFKRRMWDLGMEIRGPIGESLERQFGFLFEQLGVAGSRALVEKWTPLVERPLPPPDGLNP